MPKTNTAKAKSIARENIKEDCDINLNEESKDVRNYDFLISLSYDEFVQCFEYLFLLREIHGTGGFIRNIKIYKDMLPECWDEIRKSNLTRWFKGKSDGFMGKWLSEAIYNKIRGLTLEQMAQWLTHFDVSSTYRLQMLHGEKRQLLGTKYDKSIEEWLNEV